MSGALPNIPPLWTALFHWCSDVLYILLLPRRARRRDTALALAVILAVQCLLYRAVGALTGPAFNLATALFALWTLLPFALLCRCGAAGRVYYAARAFILGGFSVSLAWQLYVFYAARRPALTAPWGEALVMLAVGLPVLAAVFALERLHRAETREMRISVPACAGTVVMALIIYIVSSLSYTSLDTPFSSDVESEAFNIRTIVYFGGVAILFAFHLQLCISHAQQERDALQRLLDLQYTAYRVSRDSIRLVEQKYHDLKHQLSLLRGELEGGARLDYLDELEREIRPFEARFRTGSEVLDTILTSKCLTCQAQGITLTCVADGAALSSLSAMDVSALFGNALDNAIEGVSRVPEPEQRLIRLRVSRQKGFVRVSLQNRCEQTLRVRGELPATTKQDHRFHGYGLKSIRATAEKYGGSLAVHASDGWFELGVLIPLRDPVQDPRC